jgi:hypothetical protein
LAAACRERKECVTVNQRVRRANRARQSIVRHLRHPAHLFLVQVCVCSDDANDGIIRRLGRKAQEGLVVERFHHGQRIGKMRNVGPRLARADLGLARACEDLTRARFDHIAKCVDRDDGTDDQTIAEVNARRAQPGFHRLAHAVNLADRRAAARAYVTLCHRA